MKLNWNRLTRTWHYWGALVMALPVLIIILSGLFLQLKKDVAWVQPPTLSGVGEIPTLSFAEILAVAQTVPEAEIASWDDIDRLDVRPGKGIVKVQAKNHWEIQLDTTTATILQVEYRRSDLAELIHDGSFFHEQAKLWVFLPAGLVLLLLWLTGLYMLILPLRVKRKRKRLQQSSGRSAPVAPTTSSG